jgi:hypothetical protein
MAATIIQIPMPVIVCITVYLAGIWLTMLYIGIAGYSDDNACIVASSLLWPMFLLFNVVMSLVDWLDMAVQGCHGARAQMIVRRINSALHYASLPFRPYRLGRELSEWWSSWREKREVDEA